MKCFSPEFSVYPNTCPYPTKAIDWDSLKRLKEAYESFLEDCERYGQIPNDCFIYFGKSDGDEEVCGYPDYPDRIIAPIKEGSTKAFISYT